MPELTLADTVATAYRFSCEYGVDCVVDGDNKTIRIESTIRDFKPWRDELEGWEEVGEEL